MSKTENKIIFETLLVAIVAGRSGCGVHLIHMSSGTSLSVIAVRLLESSSWLCSCRNWGLVCVLIYCWVA